MSRLSWRLRLLCSNFSSRRGSSRRSLSSGWRHTVGLSLRAILRYVANFTASVARLAALAVEWTTVRGSAVSGYVSELPTCIALHRLRLAIARIVVWATALVARSCARNTGTVASTKSSAVASTTTSAATGTSTGLIGTIALFQSQCALKYSAFDVSYSEVTWLAAGVAPSTCPSAEAQGRAISLNMS